MTVVRALCPDRRLAVLFVRSAGCLFLITGSAKIISSFGQSRILAVHDPILAISFGQEFVAIGAIEVSISILCLLFKIREFQLKVIAWLATSVAIYRVGYWWLDPHYCKCLGNLPDAIHLSEHAADSISLGILAYLLVCAYGFILTNTQSRASRNVSCPER